jgi:prohibitin 2
MDKRSMVAGFFGVLAVIILFGGWSIVPPGHRGVRVTLGSVSPEAIPEGLTLKWPLIQRIQDVSIQQRRADGIAECFSSDLQTMKVQFVILYRLPEAEVVKLFQQFSGDPYQALVDSRAQETIKQITAVYAAEAAVKSREKIKTDALALLRTRVGGLVEIVDLNVANIELSPELEKAIEAKMVQEQESLAKQFALEKSKKDAEITIIAAKAESEAITIRGKALAENPSVIELEVVKKWNGVSPSTLVIGEGSASKIVLPISK